MQSLLKIESYEYASPNLLWYFNNRRTEAQARAEIAFNRAVRAGIMSGKVVVLSSHRKVR